MDIRARELPRVSVPLEHREKVPEKRLAKNRRVSTGGVSGRTRDCDLNGCSSRSESIKRR